MSSLLSRLRLVAPLCCACLLAACYLPAPAPHARLQLLSDGQCLVDGRTLSLEALPEVLAQRHQQSPGLVLELHVTPQSPETQVRQVVAAARHSGVPVAFVNDERACSASSPSGACSG